MRFIGFVHAALAVITVGALTSCRAADPPAEVPDAAAGAADAGPDAGPDAAPEIGCNPRDPRTVAPELFIGPDGLEDLLVDRIAGAEHDLDVMMYLFTVDRLADAVIAAHRRGLAVRVLLDPDHEGNPDVRARLSSAGVPIRDAPATYPFAHAKYLIVDGATAVIMSANFNYGAMNSERNYGVVDRDPDDVADLQAIFTSDWTGEGFADLDCTRLVVSPVNSRSRVLSLVNGATSTLELEVIYLSDSTVRTAVIDAHRRGVAVRVLLAPTGDFPENADTITVLENAGVATRTAVGFDLHAKTVIADSVALVGSQNLSQTSLSRNREVGVVIAEPTPAGQISAQFERDWTTARD